MTSTRKRAAAEDAQPLAWPQPPPPPHLSELRLKPGHDRELADRDQEIVELHMDNGPRVEIEQLKEVHPPPCARARV